MVTDLIAFLLPAINYDISSDGSCCIDCKYVIVSSIWWLLRPPPTTVMPTKPFRRCFLPLDILMRQLSILSMLVRRVLLVLRVVRYLHHASSNLGESHPSSSIVLLVLFVCLIDRYGHLEFVFFEWNRLHHVFTHLVSGYFLIRGSSTDIADPTFDVQLLGGKFRQAWRRPRWSLFMAEVSIAITSSTLHSQADIVLVWNVKSVAHAGHGRVEVLHGVVWRLHFGETNGGVWIKMGMAPSSLL